MHLPGKFGEHSLLSCSPNFPRASITLYMHAKHEPILKGTIWNFWYDAKFLWYFPFKVVTYKRLTWVKSLTQCPVPSLLTACFSLPPTFAARPVAVLVLMPSLAQSVVRTLLVWFAAGSQLLGPWIPSLAKLYDDQNSEKFHTFITYIYWYYNTKEGKIPRGRGKTLIWRGGDACRKFWAWPKLLFFFTPERYHLIYIKYNIFLYFFMCNPKRHLHS